MLLINGKIFRSQHNDMISKQFKKFDIYEYGRSHCFEAVFKIATEHWNLVQVNITSLKGSKTWS